MNKRWWRPGSNVENISQGIIGLKKGKEKRVLKSVNFQTIQNLVKYQSKTMFFKYSPLFFSYHQIKILGQTNSTTKLNPVPYTF